MMMMMMYILNAGGVVVMIRSIWATDDETRLSNVQTIGDKQIAGDGITRNTVYRPEQSVLFQPGEQVHVHVLLFTVPPF